MCLSVAKIAVIHRVDGKPCQSASVTTKVAEPTLARGHASNTGRIASDWNPDCLDQRSSRRTF